MPVEESIRTIESHFSVMMGAVARVIDSCDAISAKLSESPDPTLIQECYNRLLPLLREKKGLLAAALFEFFERHLGNPFEPKVVLSGLLQATDENLQLRAIKRCLSITEQERLIPDLDLAVQLARLIDQNEGFRVPEIISRIRTFLDHILPAAKNSVEELFVSAPHPFIRCLAARILDVEDPQIPKNRLIRLFGSETATFLLPYVQFSRVTHRELVDFTPFGHDSLPALDSMKKAEQILGQALLASVIAELGWKSFSCQLFVEPLVGLSLNGSFPLCVHPEEAELIEKRGTCKKVWEQYLVIAHGGSAEENGDTQTVQTIQKFRRYNVAHSEVLTEFLEISPLNEERVLRLLKHMDRIVEDFVDLFGSDAESGRLREMYANLRTRIMNGLPDLNQETSRLVQMFEDPGSLDEVKTLHGLKRYLHQKGLKNAFRLFRSSGTSNRTVDLALVTPQKEIRIIRKIRYIDFEPQPAPHQLDFPVSVQLAVHGFARQLIHGRETFPGLEILNYGNEVQVYANFLNHPAFIRIDFSPPVRGGLIDLEYFAVSQFEMQQHPDLSLQGIQHIFRAMEFDVRMDGFRLHARYDRERAFDFGDIVEQARLFFCLIPYLMEIDWWIGSLDYPEASRPLIAEGLAKFFLLWGILPLNTILSENQRRILCGFERTAAGTSEIIWDGHPPYQDLYGRWTDPESQLQLEKNVLQPFRESIERGEFVQRDGTYGPAPETLFRHDHEAERFCRILVERGTKLQRAVDFGMFVRILDPHLQFQTTGSVQGNPVQRAILPLRGSNVGLFVVRDPAGKPLMAFSTGQAALYRKRAKESDAWKDSDEITEVELARLLRSDNYIASEYEYIHSTPLDIDRMIQVFDTEIPDEPETVTQERLVPGLAASPGRATGAVCFPHAGRNPKDVEGSIFISPVIRPEDAPWIVRAAGVVSTGGGILSHAGMIALELQKPALVIQGQWRQEGSRRILLTRRPVFEEQRSIENGYRIVKRLIFSECEEQLEEGDLVSLDAARGALTLLGRSGDALNFHRQFRQMEEAARMLQSMEDPAQILMGRGRLLRSVYELEKLLQKISASDLAVHAVERMILEAEASAEQTAQLLKILFSNRDCGMIARRRAADLGTELAARYEVLFAAALSAIPQMETVPEILFTRLQVLHLLNTLSRPQTAGAHGVRRSLDDELDAAVLIRLSELNAEAEVHGSVTRPDLWLAERMILYPGDGGSELAPLIGSKAANLAAIERFAGRASVPRWFAITDHAFQHALSTVFVEPGISLRDALGKILERDITTDRKSALIRHLWLSASIPELLQQEIIEAYRALGEEAYIAIRSSALEEDTTQGAFAGQFDTFLFVRGEAAILEHVKLAWAGMWSKRAMEMRKRTGVSAFGSGGGIIVQKMISARASGVLHTVSLAAGEFTQMTINAGLGLGEGVVSGIVDVDHAQVRKIPKPRQGSMLDFHYTVGDKRDRIVFDANSGSGTRKVESQYHQRFRPALEYSELDHLVQTALLLEQKFGEPLDIEFAIEGQDLYILQARPISVFHAAVRETELHYPLRQCGRTPCAPTSLSHAVRSCISVAGPLIRR